jgi:hypothetical protein
MHAIILGCGRSGSSIFGELFERLPGYRYYFEPHFEAWPEMDFARFSIAIKIPKAMGMPTTPGLPFDLDALLARVPKPRAVFWQVRHPLDSVCSLRPGIEANWAHNPRPPEWQALLTRPWYERCARHWAYINSAGYDAVRRLPDFALVNRYEDMVKDPEKTARNVCAQLQLSGTEVEHAAAEWAKHISNRKAADSYEAKGQGHWSRTDHTVRIERWKQNLTAYEVKQVLSMVSKTATTFGYNLFWPRLFSALKMI